MNSRIADEYKYGLHVLLVKHGKTCPKCAKNGKNRFKTLGPCPLNTSKLSTSTSSSRSSDPYSSTSSSLSLPKPEPPQAQVHVKQQQTSPDNESRSPRLGHQIKSETTLVKQEE